MLCRFFNTRTSLAGEGEMNYVLAVYEDETRCAALSLNELRGEIRDYRAFGREFRNVIKGVHALQPAGSAMTVRLRSGNLLTAEGPVAKAEEQLAGFYLVEADHLDEAIAIAAKLPAARYGSVEVRPVDPDVFVTRTPHAAPALNVVSRSILTVCALILAFGAFAHARAYRGMALALGKANLAAIYANDFRTLWLADSTTLLTVAVLFLWIAARPAAPAKSAIILIALIPASTAVLLYHFVGNFYAGHLLLGTAVAAACAFLFSSRRLARQRLSR
jgi:hypothetical protein